MSANTNNQQKKSESTSTTADNPDNACVVCFKDVEIYSIGECDHPVCYECSTRMRVLCKQLECPICRQGLAKVIFTYDKLTYRELEAKNRSEYFNKEYKICFYTKAIQDAFNNLLDHPCPKCDHPVFHKFTSLRKHVRTQHNHYYCDLCTDNLKIFSFERRCYSNDELLLHCRRGDPDNKSHRGHPLCEYCDKRYLDRDELFRHLRREHYFCHFCDADGCNEFYRDYNSLRNHFRKDHYFCEEGRCATEEFTGAFRTEIDYKAHVANVHGKSFNKQQAKQARTLQLEITLGPRGRSGQTEPHIANLRSRGHNETEIEPQPPEPTPSAVVQRAPPIDARNEQEFPSLGNGAPAINLVPIPMGLRAKLGSAGLARTKENFPALGGAESGGDAGPSTSRSKQTPISSVIKKNPSSTPTPMLIHVSNRPSTSSGATSKKPNHSNKKEFPALPSSSKAAAHAAYREDLVESNSNINYDTVSAKHRSLMDDYVSVANPNNFQKLQLVQKEAEEAKAKKAAIEATAPKLDSTAFPALSMGSKPSVAQPALSWTKLQKQQREVESRKSKVAPAPLLNMTSKQKNPKSNNVQNGNSGNNNNNHNTSTENNKKKEKKNKNAAAEGKKSPGAPSTNNKQQKKENNNENKPANANTNLIKPAPILANGNAKNSPPSGFQNVTLNSVAKSPNSLTFTSSLGESYNIVPTHSFTQPPEAITRNQKLVGYFSNILESPQAFEEFRRISQRFREGTLTAQCFYDHCEAALKDKFDTIFPELLALLPDINKQQELFLVHSQRINSLPGDAKKSNNKLEVCSTCKQVLLTFDADNHFKLHALKENFPVLGNSNNKALTSRHK